MTSIVPRKAVQELGRVLGSAERLEFGLGESKYVVRSEGFELVSTLVEGRTANDGVTRRVVQVTYPRAMLDHAEDASRPRARRCAGRPSRPSSLTQSGANGWGSSSPSG